jgi:hypothetical protein
VGKSQQTLTQKLLKGIISIPELEDGQGVIKVKHPEPEGLLESDLLESDPSIKTH